MYFGDKVTSDSDALAKGFQLLRSLACECKKVCTLGCIASEGVTVTAGLSLFTASRVSIIVVSGSTVNHICANLQYIAWLEIHPVFRFEVFPYCERCLFSAIHWPTRNGSLLSTGPTGVNEADQPFIKRHSPLFWKPSWVSNLRIEMLAPPPSFLSNICVPIYRCRPNYTLLAWPELTLRIPTMKPMIGTIRTKVSSGGVESPPTLSGCNSFLPRTPRLTLSRLASLQ